MLFSVKNRTIKFENFFIKKENSMQNNWSKCIYRWRPYGSCGVGAFLSFAFSAKLILWIILNCHCHFWPMQMKFSQMNWFHFGPQFFICLKIKMEPEATQVPALFIGENGQRKRKYSLLSIMMKENRSCRLYILSS